MDNIIGYIIGAAVLLIALYKTITGQSQAAGSAVETDESKAPENLPANVARWTVYVKNFAKQHGVPWRVSLAQLWQESGGTWDPPGSAGELGLMQLKPDAVEDVRRFTGVDVTGWDSDPVKNIEVGIAYLSVNMMPGRAAGDLYLALRMYNQGPTGAYKPGRVELSRQYANKVLRKAELIGFKL